MIKIMTILGARPQFVKAAAVSREIENYSDIEEVIVHTGQHYDHNMSDIFFNEMQIPKPNYNLDINGLSQGAMTGQMIERLEGLMIQVNPTVILLYGDTNSTLAGALSGRKLNIPILHIEGGLRNFDLTIPEDVNRILTDRISDTIFYSTEVAKRNLMNEGYDNLDTKLIKTGDLMADTVFYYSKISNEQSCIIEELNLDKKEYILTTVHRQSNVSQENLTEIINALNEISKNMKLIFPIHPNTKQCIRKYDIEISDNIKLIEPIGYFDMLQLLKKSQFVITDSGGLQREAYLMKKKSLLLMEYTPWEELVDNHFSSITAIEYDEILDNYVSIQSVEPNFDINLYGNGNTSKTIVQEIVKAYGEKHV